jgi:hypothetical protein
MSKMALQIIKRKDGEKADKETIDRIREDAPQISYSSEGRISIRIPQYEGDTLVVLDRPLSRELIRFIKSGIVEMPTSQTWCAGCANELNNQLPF